MPWLGFFDKARRSDAFVLLDIVPFTKNGYQNRCAIKQAESAMWLTLPVLVKGRLGQMTDEVELNNSVDWRNKHWKSLVQSYRKARFFGQFSPFLEHVYQQQWIRLVDINGALIQFIIHELGISAKLICASDLKVHGNGTDLLVAICKAVGGDTYLSGPSGRNYLMADKFRTENIRIRYHSYTHPAYLQVGEAFIPKLSIIDLMFNHGSESLSILEAGSADNHEYLSS